MQFFGPYTQVFYATYWVQKIPRHWKLRTRGVAYCGIWFREIAANRENT